MYFVMYQNIFDVFDFSFSEESVSFIRLLENKKVTKIPDTIAFECEISDAGATVEWLKGDRPVKKGDKYEPTTDGAVRRLVIKDVDGKDAGEYSVIFKNKTSKGTLTVEGKPVFYSFLLLVCPLCFLME